MRRSCKLASVCGLFLLVVSLPAFAGSVNSFSGVTLVGVSNATVSGSFTFNSTTHQFSNISISFSGSIFNGINASDPNSAKARYQGKGWWEFTWRTKVGKDVISYSMLFNTKTNQFQAFGSIANRQDRGKFNYLSVPEGGTPLSYLMLSGIAVLAGILISGKQRRTTRTARSS